MRARTRRACLRSSRSRAARAFRYGVDQVGSGVLRRESDLTLFGGGLVCALKFWRDLLGRVVLPGLGGGQLLASRSMASERGLLDGTAKSFGEPPGLPPARGEHVEQAPRRTSYGDGPAAIAPKRRDDR